MPAAAFKLLPITFTGIKAHKKNDAVDVEWTVENEINISQYQVERSINGKQFFTVATIASKSKSTTPYKWTDNLALSGNNFYRIRSIDVNGKIEYSKVTKAFTGISQPSVSVFPNPVVNGLLNIQMMDQPKGIYIARLINNSGQVVHLVEILHTGGNIIQAVNVNKNIVGGTYSLLIITPDRSNITKKVIMQ